MQRRARAIWNFTNRGGVISLLLLLVLGLLSGCKKDEVRVYNAPKEAAEPGHVHWHLPARWEEKPKPWGGMRVGSFRVKGENNQEADVSIIPLSGTGGAELDNMNRWRLQIGLEPVGAAQLQGMTESIEIGSGKGSLFDLLGTNPETKKPERMLVATLASPGTTWFFKMTGPDGLVATQKPAFREFLKSVSLHDAGHQDALAGQSPPPTASPEPSGAAVLPKWEAPSHWQQTEPSTMLLARFTITDQSAGRAELTVSAFPGDVGGLLANVNRWRKQIDLSAFTEAELTKVTSPMDVNGTQVTLVDVTNQSRQNEVNRILAAVWPHQGRTWFFKLMGQGALIEKEKPAFIKFIQSVRFPDA